MKGPSTGKVLISGNNLTSIASSGNGIRGTTGVYGYPWRLDLTVTNNTLQLAGANTTGKTILITSGLSAGTLCANIRGNVPSGGFYNLEVDRTGTGVFWLEDHSSQGASPTDAEVMTYLANENGGGISTFASSGDLIGGVSPGTCLLPTNRPPRNQSGGAQLSRHHGTTIRIGGVRAAGSSGRAGSWERVLGRGDRH